MNGINVFELNCENTIDTSEERLFVVFQVPFVVPEYLFESL